MYVTNRLSAILEELTEIWTQGYSPERLNKALLLQNEFHQRCNGYRKTDNPSKEVRQRLKEMETTMRTMIGRIRRQGPLPVSDTPNGRLDERINQMEHDATQNRIESESQLRRMFQLTGCGLSIVGGELVHQAPTDSITMMSCINEALERMNAGDGDGALDSLEQWCTLRDVWNESSKAYDTALQKERQAESEISRLRQVMAMSASA